MKLIYIAFVIIEANIIAGHIGSGDVDRCVHIDYRGKNFTLEDDECPVEGRGAEICKKTFNISTVHMPPYSEYPLETILRKCCGKCTKVNIVNRFPNITQVTPSSINSSDFVILFLASSTATTLYGYHFIPVVFAPSVFYITSKHEPILHHLVSSSLKLYPLIVICLLMGGIAGFCMWLMETWHNEEQFPRSFAIGWFEGFWWSFISMTTVGYGDKAPRSTIARIFSVIWILIGVAMFALFTALLTAELMEANFPPDPTMTGAEVGVLRFREYDASEAAKHGGNVIETDGWDFKSDLYTLIHKLRLKEIDGILLDKYTLRHAIRELLKVYKNDTHLDVREDIYYFLHETQRTESLSLGERFSYGILVKYTEDYLYFRDTIQDNRLPLETELALDMNRKTRKYSRPNLFSPDGPYFRLSLKIIAIILGLIVVFGIVFELCRRNKLPFKYYYACITAEKSVKL